MSKMKIALFALIGLLVAVGAGWIWGSWGRWAAERQAQSAELRVQLAEARASLLSARVNLFEINFGKASADLERAKQAMSAAAGLLDKAGRTGEAASVREALAKGAKPSDWPAPSTRPPARGQPRRWPRLPGSVRPREASRCLNNHEKSCSARFASGRSTRPRRAS